MTNPDRVTAAARRALDALTDLIRDHSDPGTEALGARFELEQALLPTPPAGRMSVGEAEAALAPLEAAVRAGREAQQTSDRATLRDRIAKVLGSTKLNPPFPHCLAMADAVLSVLPEPTDQTAVRTAALREAADRLDAHMERFFAEWPDEPRTSPYALGWKDAEAELRRLADEQPTTPTATVDPISLRWGLDDIEHGDDDTTTVLLSGPDGRPYWLELDPERATALREALAGPEEEQPTTPTADQGAGATALREAADFYERVLNQSLDPDSDPRYCTAVRDVVMGLRRRADDAQPAGPAAPAKEAQPMTHGFAGISLAGRWECGNCGASGDGWYDDEDGLVLHNENGQPFTPDEHDCDAG